MGMPLNKRQQCRVLSQLRANLMVLGAMLFVCSMSFAQETVLETVDINN
jgi:hypothetical protein